MKSTLSAAFVVLILSGIAGCSAESQQEAPSPARPDPVRATNVPHAPARVPEPEPTINSPSMLEQYEQVAKLIGVTGVDRKDSYFISIPRSDLIDVTSEVGDVPVSAGLDTQIHLFKCPCGRLSAIGQFVVVDFEMNDVMDALRKDVVFKIVSAMPILLNDRPRIMIVRFQGEGTPQQIAANVREALSWVGPERNKKLPPMFP